MKKSKIANIFCQHKTDTVYREGDIVVTPCSSLLTTVSPDQPIRTFPFNAAVGGSAIVVLSGAMDDGMPCIVTQLNNAGENLVKIFEPKS